MQLDLRGTQVSRETVAGLARRQAGTAGYAVKQTHDPSHEANSSGVTLMSMSLDDSVAGNARNALFLARACDLAYYAEAEGSARFRSELGLDAKLISVDNTQVYVAENDQAIVVAFRGSEAPTTLDGLQGLAVDQRQQLPDPARGAKRYGFRGRRRGRTVSPGIFGCAGR